MKRNNETQTATETTTAAISDNVLDFSTTLKQLRRTVDPNLIRQRAGRRDRDGNVHMVEYVEWHTVADILDETAPNWVHSVKDIRSIGDIVTVTVAITIDGITREGIGTGKTASETGIKKAEHDALKRAAVKFGIARELYRREFDSIDTLDEHTETNVIRPDASPIATSMGDLVTAKQLGMIRAIGRETGIDTETESRRLMNCAVDELSKRAASEFITRLQQMQQPSQGEFRRAG